MAEINRTLIKNLATDDITYNRGVRYYSAKAIKTIFLATVYPLLTCRVMES